MLLFRYPWGDASKYIAGIITVSSAFRSPSSDKQISQSFVPLQQKTDCQRENLVRRIPNHMLYYRNCVVNGIVTEANILICSRVLQPEANATAKQFVIVTD